MGALDLDILGSGASLRVHPHDTGWRRLPWALIQVITGGPYRLRGEAGEVRIGDGEGWIIPPGLRQRIDAPQAGRAVRTTWMHLRGRLADGQDLFARWSFPLRLHRRQAAPLHRTLRAWLDADPGPGLRDQVRRQRLALELAEVLLDLGKPLRDPPPRWSEIAPILADVRADPTAPWPRQRLARLAGLSPTRFHEVFVAAVGVAPATWVRRLRIDLAKEALLAGEEALPEIAARVGFADPYHFARVFRQVEGISPGRWRRQARD